MDCDDEDGQKETFIFNRLNAALANLLILWEEAVMAGPRKFSAISGLADE